MDLQTLWFIILGVLLAGYAILDGFDFGVGLLHPIAKTDHERRLMVNSIGPLWDGNEVWLVTFGGALFAAFPEAYATVFSGMYEAFMLVLGALIFRACALEFRGKLQSPTWRKTWDRVFTVASFVAPLTFGIGVGNAMQGVPLDGRGIMRASFLDLLTWYPLLVGLLAVVMFAMHGGLFLQLKIVGDLKARLRSRTWKLYFAFIGLFMLATLVTIVKFPRATSNFTSFPALFIVVPLMFLAVANIPRKLIEGRDGAAFVSSCCTIAALVFLLGMALFPNLVVSNPDISRSLTVHNACSSDYTLTVLTIIAVIGMPFVIAYSGMVYWTFRGAVELDEHSY